jgi:hypothetical protein
MIGFFDFGLSTPNNNLGAALKLLEERRRQFSRGISNVAA